jgi:GTP pyrophosphokinase
LTAAQVIRAILPSEQLVVDSSPIIPESKGPISQILDKVVRRKNTSGIRVQDVDDVLIRFAHCCNPVPGESIIGFITRGRGVTIHKLDCPKALDLDPERRIEVSWDSDAKVEHPVAIEVTCTDKPGLLAEMSKAFSEQGVNISMANCRSTGNARAVNTFHFNVFNLNHLKQVMRAIQKIKGVYSVERV